MGHACSKEIAYETPDEVTKPTTHSQHHPAARQHSLVKRRISKSGAADRKVFWMKKPPNPPKNRAADRLRGENPPKKGTKTAIGMKEE
jgi:hypothetical protein